MEGYDPYVVVLDVAKAFSSTLLVAVFAILSHARFPNDCVGRIQLNVLTH